MPSGRLQCARLRQFARLSYAFLLRHGGNIYALQMALGHTTLDMVKHYLTFVQADLEAVHNTASPVENWRL
jgi:hypothetical protein